MTEEDELRAKIRELQGESHAAIRHNRFLINYPEQVECTVTRWLAEISKLTTPTRILNHIHLFHSAIDP